MAKPNLRPDHNGTQRAQFNSNKKKIYATQKVCGICGKPVDFRIKYPDPLSPCIDHIIPVSKGGHPSDISNMQLAHMTCNRLKSDKLAPVQDERLLKQKNISAGVDIHCKPWYNNIVVRREIAVWSS